MSDDLQTAGTSGQSASSSQQGAISTEYEDLWMTWADELIPNDEKHAYSIPPVCESWTIETERKAEKPTHPALTPATTAKIQPTQRTEGDVRDDPVVHRVMAGLRQLSIRETFLALRQFKFGDYVGEPCYAAAAMRHLPEHLHARHKKNWKEGDFDILLIHQHYGLIFCEVKAVRDDVKDLNTSQQDVNDNIRKKLREAVSELDKAEVMLSHLVHDVAPGLRVCKTMALPNLTARQVQQAIQGDPKLSQDLCRCLGAADPADITGLCLCSDQLPDLTYWFVKSVDTKLCQWWHKRVAVSGPDPQMTFDLYKRLVARLCGPAIEVTVSWVEFPHKISDVKKRFRRIALLPVEMILLNQGFPRVLLTGDHIVHQSMLLQLMTTEWLRRDNVVYVVSTLHESHKACSTLYMELQQITRMQQGCGTGRQLHLLKYNFREDSDVEKAVNYLSQTANNKPLYVITDRGEFIDGSNNFNTFCEMLLKQVPDLHLWAANFFHRCTPSGWKLHRSEICYTYSDFNFKFSTIHRCINFIGEDHSEKGAHDCEKCGQEVGRLLDSYRVPDVSGAMTTTSPTTGSTTTTPEVLLQWRDVVVVMKSDSIGDFVSGLRCKGVPISVREDTADTVLVTYDISYIENKRIFVIVDWNFIDVFTPSNSWIVTLTHSKSPEGCGQSPVKCNQPPGRWSQSTSSSQQELCRCLGAADPADITGLCVCCDQLSDLRTPWDVDDHVLGELATWWQRRVAVSGPDRHMTSELYKTLVARFCGPATTVTVSCVIAPRLSVKTLPQAVSATGMCFAEITLFPEQVSLLQRGRPRVLLHGPPGTGKTVMLQLMATDWLRNKQLVHVVSTWDKSLPSCIMLYNLLQTTLDKEGAGTPSQLMFLKYEFRKETDVEKAVNDLVQAADKNPLHVIVDEVDPSAGQDTFKTFCEKLLEQVPDLRLWAASCLRGLSPNGWEQECLTLPLRSPPTVVREVAKAEEIRFSQDVRAYSATGIPSHTDGPRLKFIGQGHSQSSPKDCEACGKELGRFLWSLRDTASESSNSTSPACGNTAPSSPDPLQWRDVFVLWWSDIAVDEPGLEDRNNPNPGLRLQSDRDTKRYDSAFKSAFKNRNIWSGLMSECVPGQVMNKEDIDDVATGASDVVWVADYDAVRGLERKVVVCVDLHGLENNPVRLHAMSRCTSQLVIVTHSPHVRPDGSPPFKKLRR